MKVELELPEIEGFEYTGEYRKAKSGEYWGVGFTIYTGPSINPYPILREKRWRADFKTGYFTLCGGKVSYAIEDNCDIDTRIYNIGFYWKTEQEANAALKKITAMLLGE